MSDQEKVFMSEGEDQEMNDAARKARSTFKYFWRELSWERRRVIPAHSLACVKISFGTDDTADNIPSVEHMWVGDIDYDGDIITGTLMSSPNWISNLNAGDQVTKKLEDIGDWMFSIQGKVYGGFSVNLMRSRMSPKELGEHDSAWGLDFGDPSDIQLEYRSEKKKKKGILGMFKKADSSQGLPMKCLNIAMQRVGGCCTWRLWPEILRLYKYCWITVLIKV